MTYRRVDLPPIDAVTVHRTGDAVEIQLFPPEGLLAEANYFAVILDPALASILCGQLLDEATR